MQELCMDKGHPEPPTHKETVTVSVTSFICFYYAVPLMHSYLPFIFTFDASTLYTATSPIYRCTSFISTFLLQFDNLCLCTTTRLSHMDLLFLSLSILLI